MVLGELLKRHMDAFVLKELFLGLELPEETRRRYYPTRKDLANLMYKAKSEGHDSTLDQENILDLIEQWKMQNPNDIIFCRPSCCTTENKHQTFLFCYQKDWQQRLLTIYGNHITLLDATYRTTRYALPLFFLCVRSNVCYLVVGAFVNQEENTASIKEALQLFKNWNKEWKPKCFLVDFCQEEINAIYETFPASKVLLCDFHREKAWTE
ncbi:uncharacterized protein LOC121398128 [Xenopus laevis]|uniref:Uncharacterized protein LOC121398128 n=1 Tax=Xenopus laevis TaxID=8355 RepID=A0A8J1LT43_XENLA|nr:uncharacterized protein LOC121398128 [Xenopus laevis]